MPWVNLALRSEPLQRAEVTRKFRNSRQFSTLAERLTIR